MSLQYHGWYPANGQYHVQPPSFVPPDQDQYSPYEPLLHPALLRPGEQTATYLPYHPHFHPQPAHATHPAQAAHLRHHRHASHASLASHASSGSLSTTSGHSALSARPSWAESFSAGPSPAASPALTAASTNAALASVQEESTLDQPGPVTRVGRVIHPPPHHAEPRFSHTGRPLRTKPAPASAAARPAPAARARRAAASKARSNISSATASLRSPSPPPKSARQTTRQHPRPPNAAPMHIPLRNFRGKLLDPPPGCLLEVNDLLILIPPSRSPSAKGNKPVNQYTLSPVPDGYRSKFEMYTCRVCSKTYDGKNARSVARRHLQDKHGVPLSVQARRTRWDYEPDRPKDPDQAREKTLKIKRDWACRNRQISRLERMHSTYLAAYGPAGIVAPCGTKLVAPEMKGNLPVAVRNKVYPKGNLDWDDMPVDLRSAVKALGHITLSEIDAEGSPEPEEGAPSVGLSPVFEVNRTPVSHSRTRHPEPEPNAPDEVIDEYNGYYHSAARVSPGIVETVIAQHYGQYAEPSGSLGPHASADPVDYAALQSALGAEAFVRAKAEQGGDLPWGEDMWFHSSTSTSEPEWSREATLEALESIPQIMREEAEEHEALEGSTANGSEHEAEEGGLALAAESLLDLHSTPARPGDMPAKPTTKGLLAPPEITPRPRMQRSNTMVQPFASSRPEAPSRSLSFTALEDDPFAFSPAPSSIFGRKRRSTLCGSPSPLSVKRRREDESPRRPLTLVRANLLTPGYAGFGASDGDKTSKTEGRAARETRETREGREGREDREDRLGASLFMTPIRSTRSGTAGRVPTSLSKMWLLSSPSQQESAAALGLVPGWSMATPGIGGVFADQ